MRIALVAVHTGPGPQAVPLANAFLQAYLATQPDIPVVTVRADFHLGEPPEVCATGILREHPDAVGFSLYVWNRELCREIAAELRRRAPGIRIFAGGPETTAAPESVLGGGYDFLVCGEGELPFAAVCRELVTEGYVAGIPGVATGTGSCISLIPADPLKDLDSIPSPWLNNILDAGHYPGILWQLSRGCSFGCEFCFDSRDPHGVRRFSLERVEAELRHFSARKVSQIFVLDSTFNQDKERAKQILRLIRKIAPRIHFHFEVRSEFIDREMAELFAGITCSLQIGLQSADPNVLRQVGRNFKPDDFAARTMLLNESGATFGFDLMYGLPGDTLAVFRQSIDFAIGLYPNHLDIFPLAVLPGTPLATRAAVLGLQHQEHPPYTLFASHTFSQAELAAARTLATACDIFYTRGKAVAWFNGVLDPLGLTPSRFLEQFAGWLEAEKGVGIREDDLADEQVWQLQRDFLTFRFASKRLKRYLPAVLDLVDYHYHYAAVLMTALPRIPSGKNLAKAHLLEMPLSLSPSAHLAGFSYEILEILEAGAPDVVSFTASLDPCGSYVVIYATSQGVCTESLDACFFDLLSSLDGTTPTSRIIDRLAVCPDDFSSFLEFAVSEGIVLLQG